MTIIGKGPLADGLRSAISRDEHDDFLIFVGIPGDILSIVMADIVKPTNKPIILCSSGEVYGGLTYAPAREDLPGLPWQKLSKEGLIYALIEQILRRKDSIVLRFGAFLDDLTLPDVMGLGDEALLKFSVLSRNEAIVAIKGVINRPKRTFNGEIYNIARRSPVSVLNLVGECETGPWKGPFPVLDVKKAARAGLIP